MPKDGLAFFQVWAYLEARGEAAKIQQAQVTGQCPPQMRIVSIKPIVVLTQPCQHKRFVDQGVHVSHGTKSALELSFLSDKDLYFDEPMQWLSPDLKTGPNSISFSADGTAEISLGSGKLKLVRQGDFCKVSRE
jgi:hypothetical protein